MSSSQVMAGKCRAPQEGLGQKARAGLKLYCRMGKKQGIHGNLSLSTFEEETEFPLNALSIQS